MQPDEPHRFPFVVLIFDEAERPVGDRSPYDFHRVYEGSVALWRDEGSLPVGRFRAIYVDVEGAVAQREYLFDIFDCDGTLYEYFQALYDHETYDIKEDVKRVISTDEDPWAPNLLILDYLAIDPQQRGRGVGLVALRSLIHNLRAGAGIVAMTPFPLQFLNGLQDHDEQRFALDFTAPQHKAVRKLRAHYKLLGFRPLPKLACMVRNPEWRLPEENELLERLARQRAKRSPSR